MKDIINICLNVLIWSLLFLCVCIAGGLAIWPIAWFECSTYERVTGRYTKLEGLTCYVQEKGVWYEWSEYKLRFATKGANIK